MVRLKKLNEAANFFKPVVHTEISKNLPLPKSRGDLNN